MIINERPFKWYTIWLYSKKNFLPTNYDMISRFPWILKPWCSIKNWSVFCKKGVLKNEACNFIIKETLVQVFSCEYFFTEQLLATASDGRICRVTYKLNESAYVGVSFLIKMQAFGLRFLFLSIHKTATP